MKNYIVEEKKNFFFSINYDTCKIISHTFNK